MPKKRTKANAAGRRAGVEMAATRVGSRVPGNTSFVHDGAVWTGAPGRKPRPIAGSSRREQRNRSR
jgi:hypothetical protein